MNVLVVNGPNLNLLGKREPAIYGRETLNDLRDRMTAFAGQLEVQVDFFQSNHEGTLIDRLQDVDAYQGIIINPGGLSHTSVSLRDCLAALPIPVIEVHLSNIAAREEFRRVSLVSPVCRGVISGCGTDGYLLALRHLVSLHHAQEK